MATLVAKMRVLRVTRAMGPDGEPTEEGVTLTAVSGPQGSENAAWAQWTPHGVLEMTITNPAAFGKLVVGHELLVHLAPAETKDESPPAG